MLRSLALIVTCVACAIAPVAAYDAGATQRVEGARIAALAATAAQKLVPQRDRSLAAVYPATDQIVPAGALAVAALPAQMSATYVSVPVQISVNGHLERTVYVGYRVTVYAMMPVAAHDLAFGAVLGKSDLDFVRMPKNSRTPSDVDALLGRKVMHSVSAGAAIFVEDTAVNPLVSAGDPAQLVVRDGDVMVAVDVIAKASGGLGQTVIVLNPQTHKIIPAVVTGPGRVEFVLPGGN